MPNTINGMKTDHFCFQEAAAQGLQKIGGPQPARGP